jgi:hypothetical protein
MSGSVQEVYVSGHFCVYTNAGDFGKYLIMSILSEKANFLTCTVYAVKYCALRSNL